MDREQAKKIMETLRAAYPKYYDGLDNLKSIVDLWAVMFADDDAAVVAAAVKGHIATNRFAPAPADIKEMIRKIQQPRITSELSAWGMVKKAIRNGAWHAVEEWEKLPQVIQEIVTPEQIKDWATSEKFNDEVNSSNFMRSYRAAARRRAEIEALPQGVRKMIGQATILLEGGKCEQ